MEEEYLVLRGGERSRAHADLEAMELGAAEVLSPTHSWEKQECDCFSLPPAVPSRLLHMLLFPPCTLLFLPSPAAFSFPSVPSALLWRRVFSVAELDSSRRRLS